MLLFTNAEREDNNLLIDEFGDIFNEDSENADEEETEGSPKTATVETDDQSQSASLTVGEPEPFDPENIPEEAKIIEFLQLANSRPQRERLRKIAIIVSAWDSLSREPNITPETWPIEKCPILEQFLKYNANLWDPRIYGVSAQGGRLPQDKERLEKIKRPSERVTVVGHASAPHDLTAPLRWLMVVR